MRRSYTFDVVLVVPGMAFSGDSLNKHSLGGSETCGLCLAKHLARLGNRVTVFCNCDLPPASGPGVYDGVIYRPLTQASKYITSFPHDITIVQRWPQAFAGRTCSRLNILWNHDLALKRNKVSVHQVMWNVDRVVTVSQWHAKQQEEVYGLPEQVFWPIHNGVSVRGIPFGEGDPYRLLYCARPERGLVNLVGPDGVMEKLLKIEPKFHLYVAGYDNTVPEMRGLYEYLWGRIEELPNCTNLGHLNKQELYRQYQSAGIYAYCSDFEEVFCISAVEAMASGTVFVCNDVGALREVLGNCGYFVSGQASTPDYQDRFIKTLLYLARNPSKRKQLAERGRKRAEQFDWGRVVEQWMEKFHQFFSEQTQDKERLKKHFIYYEDIEVARTLMDEGERAEIDKQYQGAAEGVKQFYTEQFLEEGPTGVKSIEEVEGMVSPVRLQFLVDYLKEHTDIKTVVDFGSDVGQYIFNLAKQFPTVHFTGVEVVPEKVELAKRLNKYSNVNFVVGDENSTPGQYDCLVAFEILEHFRQPWAVVRKVEKWVKEGGHVLISVPFGSWGISGGEQRYKAHFWHFDRHDLRDMFGRKPGYTVNVGLAGNSPRDGEPLGWHFVTYRQKSSIGVGQVDMERKCFIQRPRQTIAACLIVKDAEAMLHRALKSVKPFDEIIVMDTGSSDSTVEIAKQYTDKVYRGPNPLEVGFDVVRNECIKRATTDFILWMDADEELIEARDLFKYLRTNMYNGYIVKQHHFSIFPEHPFKPDQPVRVFRNGLGIRFWGCVAEDALVATNPDFKPIREIKVGDYVRVHDGSYQRVEKIWSYDVDEEFLEIVAVGSPEPLRISKSHEVFAVHTKKCINDRKYNVRCKPICRIKDRCNHHFFEDYKIEKVKAGELQVGDLLLCPLPKLVKDREMIYLSEHAEEGAHKGSGSCMSWKLVDGTWIKRQKGKVSKVPDGLLVDDRLLRLIGYYISDGYISEGAKINFSFGLHETEYVEDVKEMASYWGMSSWCSYPKQCRVISVVIGCRPLAEWLKGEIGSGARNKKVPQWVMLLPTEKQRALLRGLWRGDGCVEGSLVRYTTVSKMLAYQVNELLLRQGFMPNFRYNKTASTYEVFARVKRKQFLDWEMPKEGPIVPTQSWSDGEYRYMRIKSIRPIQYRGKVYDLTVANKHSYVVNGVSVSNCVHEHPHLPGKEAVVPVVCLADVGLAHDGYLSEERRRKKFYRNINLVKRDREKYPERTLGKYLIMRDWVHMARYILEGNGRQVTPEVVELCERAVKMYQDNFLGSGDHLEEDGLPYYTEALAILGRGFEVAWALKADRQIDSNPPVIVARFASSEDLIKYLRSRIKVQTKDLEGKYV